jgi:hypothetical protein
LAACAPTSQDPPAALSEVEAPHGFVEGAEELSEPPLHLATIDTRGQLGLLDLLDPLGETRSVIGELGAVHTAETDGRFVFAATDDGLTIADTGVWTVDHEDHVHYYRAEPRIVGAVEGSGAPTVRSSATVTAVTFPETGTVTVLDRGALGSGTITEIATLELGVGADAAQPLGSVILAGVAEFGTGAPSMVRAYDDGGVEIASAACTELDGTIATRVGVVYGCADGAVLATETAAGVAFERIPYPGAVASGERARDFANRAGRPTVAAPAGETGAWILDTRERRWDRIATTVPLAQVTAIDDADHHVVAVTTNGSVLVLDARGGAVLAETEPLLASSLLAPEFQSGLELTVDARRAYVNAATEKLVYEIDFTDSARIARSFVFDTAPAFAMQTGR